MHVSTNQIPCLICVEVDQMLMNCCKTQNMIKGKRPVNNTNKRREGIEKEEKREKKGNGNQGINEYQKNGSFWRVEREPQMMRRMREMGL